MAIKPLDFYNKLSAHGINFFTGVPDSLLKEFCLCIDDFVPKDKHIITANEGNAIALAAGYYLAKKSLPLVYMQNSGLGNAINPLLSLCDPDVYAIPMVVVVGWRVGGLAGWLVGGGSKPKNRIPKGTLVAEKYPVHAGSRELCCKASVDA